MHRALGMHWALGMHRALGIHCALGIHSVFATAGAGRGVVFCSGPPCGVEFGSPADVESDVPSLPVHDGAGMK
jgi:hypothetical protein